MEITIEGETLVDKLMAIQNTEFLREESKKGLLIKVLDEYREDHPLLDEAAKGEVSIPDVVEELLEPYKKWRLLGPVIRGKSYNEELEKRNLHKLISGYIFEPSSQLSYQDRVTYWIVDKCANALGVAFFMALYAIGWRAIVGGGQEGLGKEAADYFILNWIVFIIGSLGCINGIKVKKGCVDKARIYANYLHEMVQGLYKS